MKKLINDPNNILNEMFRALVRSNSKIKYIENENVIVLKDVAKDKVALISGGGAGHEPAHAGYVAKGMLSAAVSGQIFTSPTPKAILKAIELCKDTKGILLIVKNYTGDVLNFKIAKKMAKTKFNIEIESVLVNDDVAVLNSSYTIGRRGIAGTILVHKIAGAAAGAGKSLKDVQKIAEEVIAKVRTIGISTSSIFMPATGQKSFELKEDQFEFGLGIHGEPGIKQQKIIPVKKIVHEMLDLLFKDYDYINKEVVLMLNGLGGSPQMELLVALNDALNYAKSKKIIVKHIKVGNFMTSMEMQGFSISLLEINPQLETLFLDKSDSSSWN